MLGLLCPRRQATNPQGDLGLKRLPCGSRRQPYRRPIAPREVLGQQEGLKPSAVMCAASFCPHPPPKATHLGDLLCMLGEGQAGEGPGQVLLMESTWQGQATSISVQATKDLVT